MRIVTNFSCMENSFSWLISRPIFLLVGTRLNYLVTDSFVLVGVVCRIACEASIFDFGDWHISIVGVQPIRSGAEGNLIAREPQFHHPCSLKN